MATVKVVDSSVLAKYLLKEEGWRKAGLVLRERPYTLDLAVKEAANALWKRVTLLGDIGVEKALTLLEDLLRLRRLLRIEPQEAYLQTAFRIAVDRRVTVYDALFIAQAKEKKATLVTSDEKQYRVAQELGVTVELVE